MPTKRKRRGRAAPARGGRSTSRHKLPRNLIDTAMEFERRTMQLYCRFENLFDQPGEIRRFWFEMAQHESRHVGALALVDAMLKEAPGRAMPPVPAMTGARVDRMRKLLSALEKEASGPLTLPRAFEMALEIEGSEIEELVLDLLTALKGQVERERALQLLIHDLGDLSYMIEKHTSDRSLLARADKLIEHQVGRLRRSAPASPTKRASTKPSRS